MGDVVNTAKCGIFSPEQWFPGLFNLYLQVFISLWLKPGSNFLNYGPNTVCFEMQSSSWNTTNDMFALEIDYLNFYFMTPLVSCMDDC